MRLRLTHLPSFILMALAAVGCVDIRETADLSVEYETVYLEAGEPHVRASMDPDGKVFWDPGDKIQLFTPSGGMYDFTSLTEERSDFTVFSGEVPVGTSLNGSWAVYPSALYSSIFSGSVSSLTVQLDSVQTAVEGTLPEGGIISLSKLSGTTLDFKHLCAGLKFRLIEDGVESVTVRSRGGNALSGLVRVVMKNGAPNVSSFVRQAASVTLKAPEGECLRSGVWYYVGCLPCSMPRGVELVLRKGNHTSSKVIDRTVTFTSGRIGVADSLDRGMNFEHLPVLEAAVSEVEFATAGGDSSIVVRSTSEPTATPDAEWLDVYGFDMLSYDDGVATWRLSISAATSDLAANRSCKLVISSSDSSPCTVNIVQRHGYESTDYSLDGRVTVLQTASYGRGLDLVFVGDAFTDRLVADGTSLSWLEAAAESFFEVEPFSSFRDRFNVYLVDAVSRNEEYGSRMSHAMGSAYEGSSYSGSLQAAGTYACRAVTNLDEATVVVVMNNSRYGGVSYFGQGKPGEYASGLGVGFVPHCSDTLALGRLVRHEGAGHCFAKLGDEYVTVSGAVSVSARSQKIEESELYGWWANLDFASDSSSVKWSHFLYDTRYAGEGVGVFEGGMNYSRGVWRPSATSIMVDNKGGFNAPSREMIYKRIRHLSEGDDWEYSYEEFVNFDLGMPADTLTSDPAGADPCAKTTVRRLR